MNKPDTTDEKIEKLLDGENQAGVWRLINKKEKVEKTKLIVEIAKIALNIFEIVFSSTFDKDSVLRHLVIVPDKSRNLFGA